MTNRTSTDGVPYYCIICGQGYDHFLQCADKGCVLEAPMTAMSRKRQPLNITAIKKVKDLVPGDMIYLDDGSVKTVKEISHGSLTRLKGQDSPRYIIIYWQEGDFTQASREFDCECFHKESG